MTLEEKLTKEYLANNKPTVIPSEINPTPEPYSGTEYPTSTIRYDYCPHTGKEERVWKNRKCKSNMFSLDETVHNYG